MLSEFIGYLLVPAAGIALSPFPVIAITFVLGTKKPRLHGIVFTLGWIIALLLLTFLGVAMIDVAEETYTGTSMLENWGKIGLGLLLFFLAWKKWKSRPKKGEKIKMPGWVETVNTASAGKMFVLGAALGGMNPKNIAFAIVASATIVEQLEVFQQELVLAGVFVILSSLSILLPLILYILLPKTATHYLSKIREFMVVHNKVIMAILFIIFGILLLNKGISGILY